MTGGPLTFMRARRYRGAGIMPSRAFAFLDIIGINGYIDGTDAQYVNTTTTVADAVYLGATKWREPLANTPEAISGMQALIAAGFQFSIIPYGGNIFDNINMLHDLATAFGGASALRWVEGPNEPDHPGWMPTFVTTAFGTEAPGYQAMAHYMAELYTTIKADGVLHNILIASPTDDGSEDANVGLQFAKVPAGGAGTTATGGTSFYDVYNIHDYPNWNNQAVGLIDPSGVTLNGNPNVINERLGEQFVTTRIGGYAGNSLATVLASPRIMSEFNWATVEITDTTKRGIAISNAYLVGFKQGMQALICYALYPDGVGNELFSATATPTPAATIIHNMTTILHDPGGTAATFTPAPIGVTVTGLPADGMWFLLQKASGNHQVVLWRNTTNYNRSTGNPITITPVNVTVNTGTAPTTIRLYDILVGTSPTSTLTSATSIVVALADGCKIVDIT